MIETVKLEVTIKGFSHTEDITSEQHAQAAAERVRCDLVKSLCAQHEDDVIVVPCR